MIRTVMQHFVGLPCKYAVALASIRESSNTSPILQMSETSDRSNADNDAH